MSNDRAQPSDVEAEKSVLGALLIENGGYAQISSQLESRHFFREAHRRIYRAMAALLDAGKPADIRLLIGELERRGDLEEVGGPAYVSALVDGVPMSTNVRYYAEVVREKAALRALVKFGSGLALEAYDGETSARELVVRADQRLTALATECKLAAGAVSLERGLPALSADLAARVERKGQITGWPSGVPGIDLLTHGWQRRKMIVIAGQTSFGKSVLALDQAHAITGAGGRVVYYSYEMERQELEYRLWSKLAEIPLTRILWGNVSEREYRQLAEAQEVMAGLPLEINDTGSRSIVDVRAECRQIKAERGLAAVVVDHIQLMEAPEGGNRYEELAYISKGLKTLAMDLDVPVFVLSQLTLSDKDANREPQLDDLRECKSIGHDADAVLMLHPYRPAEARTDIPVVPMKLLFRKQRGGRLGLVTLNLERDYVRFVEAEPPAPVVKETKPKTGPKPRDFKW